MASRWNVWYWLCRWLFGKLDKRFTPPMNRQIVEMFSRANIDLEYLRFQQKKLSVEQVDAALRWLEVKAPSERIFLKNMLLDGKVMELGEGPAVLSFGQRPMGYRVFALTWGERLGLWWYEKCKLVWRRLKEKFAGARPRVTVDVGLWDNSGGFTPVAWSPEVEDLLEKEAAEAEQYKYNCREVESHSAEFDYKSTQQITEELDLVLQERDRALEAEEEIQEKKFGKGLVEMVSGKIKAVLERIREVSDRVWPRL